MNNNPSLHTRTFWAVAFVILISLIEFRVVLLIHMDDLSKLLRAAYGIVIGEPHWKEYQNRLLGPYLVMIMTKTMSLKPFDAFILLTICLHILKNTVFFFMATKLTENIQEGLKVTVLFVFGFLAIQHSTWLYFWDYFDVIAFTVFLYGVFTIKKNIFYVTLFLLALLNKETCLFIPAWMIIDSVIYKPSSNKYLFKIGLFNPRRFITGALLLVIGISLIVFLRDALLVKEIGVEANKEFAMERPFHFARNLTGFISSFSGYKLMQNVAINVMQVGLPVAAITLQKYFDDRILKLVLSMLMIYLSIWLFGLIYETRIYSPLIPYFVFLWMHFGGLIKAETGGPVKPAESAATP